MPTDHANAKFLYAILQQLDLKSVDWNRVAAQLEITNGHAARMRLSRLKHQMEGVAPTPRRSATAVLEHAGRGAKRGRPAKATATARRGKERADSDARELETDAVGVIPIAKFEPGSSSTDTFPPAPQKTPSGSSGGGAHSRPVVVIKPEPREEEAGARELV
ncbi:MAG: hypothetical protein M1813_008729 [Trichoglossum hirsutum]|nr:MAG: hypothetical protein M1813_008729 [Trichoglossum hirsutum]